MRRTLERFYRKMAAVYSPMNWWPGQTRWEIMVGAVLTQNTAWTNVEKAIAALRSAGRLEYRAMRELSELELAGLIRSSGYYNQKAARLKRLIAFVETGWGGDLQSLGAEPTEGLRQRLLGISGIGPETADSILLYALGHPIFVVDAYTRRLLVRHRLAGPEIDYRGMQRLFMTRLPPDVVLYNEYHALIVRTGNQHCWRRNPDCASCPLGTERNIAAHVVA